MKPYWLTEEMFDDLREIEESIYRDSLGLVLGTSSTPAYDHLIARSLGL